MTPDIDPSYLYRLSAQHLEDGGGQVRFRQLERALLYPALRQRGEYLVIAVLPFLAAALARTIAVADMHTARDGCTLEGMIHRLHTPRVQLVGQARDGRLVELDELAAGVRERADLAAQRAGESERQRTLVSVIFVVDAVHQRGRTGKSHLDRFAGKTAQEPVIHERPKRAQRYWADDARDVLHHGAAASG